jgi:hypothetical protein
MSVLSVSRLLYNANDPLRFSGKIAFDGVYPEPDEGLRLRFHIIHGSTSLTTNGFDLCVIPCQPIIHADCFLILEGYFHDRCTPSTRVWWGVAESRDVGIGFQGLVDFELEPTFPFAVDDTQFLQP